MAGFLPKDLSETTSLSNNDILIVEKSGKNFVEHIKFKNLFESKKGKQDGYAPLGSDLKIPSSYLPSYVDDVLEFDTFNDLPTNGENGKIYVTKDDNKQYRWSGSQYVQITSGAVDSVNGKTGVVVLTTGDISEDTDKKYVTDAEKNKLSLISVTNTVNLDNVLLYSDIGVTVQAYNADTVVDANYVHTDNNYDDASKAKVEKLEELASITCAPTVTLDFSTHLNYELTADQDFTLANPQNVVPGQSGFIFIKQDSTGGRLITLDTAWKTAGGSGITLSTNPDAVDFLRYEVLSSSFIKISIENDIK